MRRTRHRRPEGAASPSPSDLSRPPTDRTSHATAPSDGGREAVGKKRRQARLHLRSGDVLNAFWQKTDLTLVVPDDTTPNGIRFQRLKSEHSCFVKREDLPEPDTFVRKLNQHHAVRKALWEGDWLRIVWQDRDALKHYCKLMHATKHGDGLPRTPIPTYEGMVSPVLRYMVDNDLKPARPRRVWIDLETDSDVPFSAAIEGEARILSWATEDEHGNRASAMLAEDTDEAETTLLRAMWVVLEMYDQVLAWGGDRFDFPIIKARSILHNLLRETDREWRRWLWLDHLEQYRKMAMASAESGDEKTSMALNAVAVSLGVGEKDDFDSSRTRQAWENDKPCKSTVCMKCRACLLRYNIQDTALMPLIEAKTGFVMLLQTVSDTCGTFPDSRGSNPGVQVEGFLARLAHDRGHKFPTVLKPAHGDKYEGAYVLHPEKEAGVHRGVHVADFASLYPTIICTWNISPETILEGDVDPDDDTPFAFSPLTNERFDASGQGILPLAVSQLMELRKKWNDKKGAATPGTDEWKDADRRSSAYKITANSFYGVIGATSSRHYDRRVAESITQCAKYLLLETLKAAEDRRMRVIYGDTDSLFVADATRVEFEEFVEWCNAELYPRILDELGCPTNRIKLAYEKEFDRLVFTTAKRYVGNYVHYKGTDADETSKPEIKGLEFKRGDSLRITRRFQEEVANGIVGYQTEADPDDPETFVAIVDRWQDIVLNRAMELEDIVVSKRLNKPLDEYTANQPFIRIAKEMFERGEDVGEGAKIAYVVTGASDSPQTTIQAHEYDGATTVIDRIALWEKTVWPPTQKLLKAAFPGHDWKGYAGALRKRKAAEAKERRDAKVAERKRAKAAKAALEQPPPPRRRRRPPPKDGPLVAPAVDQTAPPRRRSRRRPPTK